MSEQYIMTFDEMKMNVFDEAEAGAISGAITDADTPRAVVHAYKYYEYIRNITTDIEKIANNTGYTKDQILMVKNYIFYDKHELQNGYSRFEPDFYMAQSWQRLAFEPEKIKEHDKMLIKHELYEMSLVTQGIPYRQAHDMANEKGYNYEKLCKEYYAGLDKSKIEQKLNNANRDYERE